MVPKPRVWLVSSEDRITVGGLAPVSSVRRAVTVTVFSPSLSSTVLGLKSNSVTTGASVSEGVGVTAFEASEAGESPTAFEAVTVNV